MRFLLGFGIGIALGMVFAPARGEETRAQVKGKLRELVHLPQQKIEERLDEAAEQAQQKAGEIGSRIGREVAESTARAISEQVLGNKPERTA